MDYAKILKRAYKITISHPSLWFFGLFLIGGLNLNFIYVEHIAFDATTFERYYLQASLLLRAHPLAVLSLMSLACFIIIILWVLANWAKVMLLVYAQIFLQRHFPKDQYSQTPLGSRVVLEPMRFHGLWGKMQASVYCLRPVLAVNALTTLLLWAVIFGLFIPPLLWVHALYYQIGLISVATLLLIPLVFFISCLNVFAPNFIVIFGKRAQSGLNLATDLLVVKWQAVLGLVLLLIIIYAGSFFAGAAILSILNWVFGQVGEIFIGLGILPVFAIITVVKVVSVIFFWTWLAILNAFFNVALLVLFYELITVLKKRTHDIEQLQPMPVAHP